MKKFKDNTGHEWGINLTIGAMFRIKRESRFDLLEPRKNDLAVELETDFVQFWEALWHIVSPQAAADGVSAEEFGERMGPESLIAASDEFFAEWIDFFRQLRRPEEETSLAHLLHLRHRALNAVRKKAEKELPAMSEEFDKKLDQHLENSLANWRVSLDEILSPTPGENSGPAPTESAKPDALN